MRKVLAFILALTMAFSLVACSGSENSSSSSNSSSGGSSSSSSGGSSSSAEPVKVEIPFVLPEGDGTVGALPRDIQEFYSNMPCAVSASAYADFKAVAPPWDVYVFPGFFGNQWQQEGKEYFDQEIERYREAGLIGEYVFQDSNNDLTTQLQQMQTAIEQGADIIFVQPISTTGLNDVIKQAYDAGIVVVSYTDVLETPYALSASVNVWYEGATLASAIVEHLNGEGTVLMVDGTPGFESNDNSDNGAFTIFEMYPGIKVEGPLNGAWNEATAKSKTMEYLSTHPAQIDAVWTQVGMFRGIVEAFDQTGRDVPAINFCGPFANELAYVHENIDNPNIMIAGTANQPWVTCELAWQIGVLTLMGCGPKVTCYPCIVNNIDNELYQEWYNDECTMDNERFVKPPADFLWTMDMLEATFNKAPEFPRPTALMEAYGIE